MARTIELIIITACLIGLNACNVGDAHNSRAAVSTFILSQHLSRSTAVSHLEHIPASTLTLMTTPGVMTPEDFSKWVTYSLRLHQCDESTL